MKKPILVILILTLLCFYTVYINAAVTYKISGFSNKRSFACNDSMTRNAKPKVIFLIDEISTSHTYRFSESKKPVDSAHSVSYFLINNSDDTLTYTNTACINSKFYLTDNNKLIVHDNYYWPHDSIKRVIILPHRGITGNISLGFYNTADTGFKFKIGIRLLKWKGGNSKTVLNRLAHERLDTIWSDMVKLKTDDRLKSYSSYEAMKEEGIAQSLKKPLWAFFPAITDIDRRNYVLVIDQSKILKLKDTLIRKWNTTTKKPDQIHFFFVKCALTITNNTADTLEYMNMECSWRDIYRVKADHFSIEDGSGCFKNVLTTIKVPPHQSDTVYIALLTHDKNNAHHKIKIGMSLQKYLDRDQFDMFFRHQDALMVSPKISNMIWSNEVVVP